MTQDLGKEQRDKAIAAAAAAKASEEKRNAAQIDKAVKHAKAAIGAGIISGVTPLAENSDTAAKKVFINTALRRAKAVNRTRLDQPKIKEPLLNNLLATENQMQKTEERVKKADAKVTEVTKVENAKLAKMRQQARALGDAAARPLRIGTNAAQEIGAERRNERDRSV